MTATVVIRLRVSGNPLPLFRYFSVDVGCRPDGWSPLTTVPTEVKDLDGDPMEAAADNHTQRPRKPALHQIQQPRSRKEASMKSVLAERQSVRRLLACRAHHRCRRVGIHTIRRCSGRTAGRSATSAGQPVGLDLRTGHAAAERCLVDRAASPAAAGPHRRRDRHGLRRHLREQGGDGPGRAVSSCPSRWRCSSCGPRCWCPTGSSPIAANKKRHGPRGCNPEDTQVAGPPHTKGSACQE